MQKTEIIKIDQATGNAVNADGTPREPRKLSKREQKYQDAEIARRDQATKEGRLVGAADGCDITDDWLMVMLKMMSGLRSSQHIAIVTPGARGMLAQGMLKQFERIGAVASFIYANSHKINDIAVCEDSDVVNGIERVEEKLSLLGLDDIDEIIEDILKIFGTLEIDVIQHPDKFGNPLAGDLYEINWESIYGEKIEE